MRDVMRYIINYAMVAGIAVVLAASFHLDDQLITTTESEAAAQARIEFRRDLAAAKLCRETHINSGYTWTTEGELVCLPRWPR